jgi:ubiquinone/menaquinone biosynthesis C-methylase UbiE
LAQKHNKSFYLKAIKKYGISPLGVHWNSKHSQYKRFEIITKFIKKDIKSSTIIDVGCGMGEYYKYLELNHLLPKKYYGVDCEKDMIDICKKRFPLQNFKVQNIIDSKLENADYYICSGALNILNLEEIYTFITKCYEASNKAFVFNFLKFRTFNNIKTQEIVLFCDYLSRQLEAKTDYLDSDITIMMKK